MSFSRFLMLAVTIGLLSASLGRAAVAADLTVTVSGVKDARQTVRVALYADAETFRHEQKAFRVVVVPAAAGSVTALFQGVPAGRYAVLAYHDEDGNQKLNLLLGMFPEEGWGLSNDPSVFGPPRFDDSAFDVVEPGTEISVPLHY